MGAELFHMDVQTNTKKLIIAFRNFAIAANKRQTSIALRENPTHHPSNHATSDLQPSTARTLGLAIYRVSYMQTVSTYNIRSFSCYWAQLLAAQATIFSMFYKSDHTAHCFHRPTADYNWCNLLTTMRYLRQFLRMTAGIGNHNKNKYMSW